jgi:hypothetical protein
MTRYTNVGWKRTYHQAGFDPNDDQIPRSTPSTPVPGSSDAAAQFESIDTPVESNRKRRRKCKADSERMVAVDSTPAAIASDEGKTSSSVAEKKSTKVVTGRPKPKTKEKTRRAKSVYILAFCKNNKKSILIFICDNNTHSTSQQVLQTEPRQQRRGG